MLVIGRTHGLAQMGSARSNFSPTSMPKKPRGAMPITSKARLRRESVLSDGAHRPAEVILPEAMAEYGHGWAAAPIRIANHLKRSAKRCATDRYSYQVISGALQ